MKLLKPSSIVFIVFALISCENIFFEHPQPIEEENHYNFPPKYIGHWIDTTHEENLVVTKSSVYWDIKRSEQVRLKMYVDTSQSIILKDNKLYEVNTQLDTYLSNGYTFNIKNDTVFYNHITYKQIALSDLNFIRKLNDYYVLNLKGENEWLTLVLFYINKDKHLIIRGIKREDIAKLNQENIIYQKEKGESFQLFSNQKWSKEQWLKFIKQAGFSDTLMHLQIKKEKISYIN